MSKNNKSLAMAATLTGLLIVGPALIAQSTIGVQQQHVEDDHGQDHQPRPRSSAPATPSS